MESPASPHEPLTAEAIARGYEPRDATPKGIIIFTVVLTAVVTVVSLLIALLMRYYEGREHTANQDRPARYGDTRGLYPNPRLQGDPAADLAEARRIDAKDLDTYGWVDRKAGVARIPISRAMDALVEKGLPTGPTQKKNGK